MHKKAGKSGLDGCVKDPEIMGLLLPLLQRRSYLHVLTEQWVNPCPLSPWYSLATLFVFIRKFNSSLSHAPFLEPRHLFNDLCLFTSLSTQRKWGAVFISVFEVSSR
jgi:hypothetical protein